MNADSESISVNFDCKSKEREEASQLLARPVAGAKANQFSRKSFVSYVIFMSVCGIVVFIWRHRKANAEASGELPPATVLAMIVFACGAICSVVAYVPMRRARLREESRWRGQNVYTFAQGGLSVRRPGRTDFYPWRRFRALHEGANVFVLRTDERNGIVIPKRLFADAVTIEGARRMMQSGVTVAAIPQALGFPINTQ